MAPCNGCLPPDDGHCNRRGTFRPGRVPCIPGTQGKEMSAVRVVSPYVLAGMGLGLSAGNLFTQLLSVAGLVAMLLFARSTGLRLAGRSRQAREAGKHR